MRHKGKRACRTGSGAGSADREAARSPRPQGGGSGSGGRPNRGGCPDRGGANRSYAQIVPRRAIDMTTMMKAAVVPAKCEHWVLQEVPKPEAGPHQVLVKIHACGICYTD